MTNSTVDTLYAEIRTQAEKAAREGHFVITATQPPRPGCVGGGFKPYDGPIIIDYIDCLGVRG